MAATTTDLATAPNAAIHGGYVAHLTGQTYTISSPIAIHVTATMQGALGIDGGDATFVSQVTNGAPLIKLVVDPGADLRYLTLSSFTIEGNGREGDGIQIVADGNTFSSSGAQSIGISGYLSGGATLVDNTSTDTGPGSNTPALANLQGNGNAFLTGDDGPISSD